MDRTAQGLRPRFLHQTPPTDAAIATVLQNISRRAKPRLRGTSQACNVLSGPTCARSWAFLCYSCPPICVNTLVRLDPAPTLRCSRPPPGPPGPSQSYSTRATSTYVCLRAFGAVLSAAPRSAAPSRACCRSCGSSRRLPEGCYRKRRDKTAFENPIRSVNPTVAPQRHLLYLPAACSAARKPKMSARINWQPA